MHGHRLEFLRSLKSNGIRRIRDGGTLWAKLRTQEDTAGNYIFPFSLPPTKANPRSETMLAVVRSSPQERSSATRRL